MCKRHYCQFCYQSKLSCRIVSFLSIEMKHLCFVGVATRHRCDVMIYCRPRCQFNYRCSCTSLSGSCSLADTTCPAYERVHVRTRKLHQKLVSCHLAVVLLFVDNYANFYFSTLFQLFGRRPCFFSDLSSWFISFQIL